MALFLCSRRVLLRAVFNSKRSQSGYVILVPEIGEEVPEKRLLFRNDGLPEFNNVNMENCRIAIGKETLDYEAGVKSIEERLNEEQCGDVFNEVIKPLERLCTPLDRTWGLSKVLYLTDSNLMPNLTYTFIHERARRARASKFNKKNIYAAVKSELLTDKKRTAEENRILLKFAVEGKLNGLELDSKNYEILTHYLFSLIRQKNMFKQKVEVATKQFTYLISNGQIVRDFPVNLLKKMSADPKYPLRAPWKVTLQQHICMPVLEYCPDRDIRWKIWQALVGRCSGYSENHELSSGAQLQEIRFVRKDIAKLLGYQSYAEMSMETKMAGSLSNVQTMLNLLLEKARPAQEEEVNSLYQFAAERGFKADRLELWDVPYWRRKQQKFLFNCNEDTFKEYFPLQKVLEGLFGLCSQLFNVTIKQRSNIPTWNRDVKFYDIFDPNISSPIAGFYLDPYIRSDKVELQGIGSMVAIHNRSQITDTKPLCALIFNFDIPSAEKQTYLTFEEVKFLFRKFGHALLHLLTQTNYSEVAGSSNVEWDAVEVSEFVFSHFLYNKNVLDSISCHCDSGEKLPQEMFQTLLGLRTHMAGLDLSRELYLSALDLELHSSKDYWLDIMKRLWPQYRCFTLHKIDSHPCSFEKIILEGWGAAYYCQIWARMLAADVYSAFEEVQGDEQQILDVAKRYRDTFLAIGGSCHPSQVFREFRGRDPSPQALLSYIRTL